jgi:hypothetical protein
VVPEYAAEASDFPVHDDGDKIKKQDGEPIAQTR